MRFRSYDKVAVESFLPAQEDVIFNRGRHTKIQNNLINVSAGHSSDSVDFYTELQPLSRKDGQSFASAIISAVKGPLDAIQVGLDARGAKAVKVLHFLIGDGINTNENAGKKVLHHFTQGAGRNVQIQYRFVGNTADLISNPLEASDLCTTFSKLYKYLVRAYLDELLGSLVNRFI